MMKRNTFKSRVDLNKTADPQPDLESMHSLDELMIHVEKNERAYDKKPEYNKMKCCGCMGKCCSGFCTMFCDKVQDIGAISLPLAYNGKAKFAHWIGYLFAVLAVIAGTTYTVEQWNKIGTVRSMPNPEPIQGNLTAKDVKEQFYQGGLV